MLKRAKQGEGPRRPPVVLTPDELARRDEAAQELTAQAREQGVRVDIHAPDSPLRDPGEPCPPGTGGVSPGQRRR